LQTSPTVPARYRFLRIVLAATAIVSCLFVIQTAARYGFSQVLITFSLTTGNLTAANKAAEVTPKSAEAHLADAALLTATRTADQGISELERAVALRPADYLLWSQLGLLRDQTGDNAGALQAFDEAVRRAPFYSQPRWDRGNVLLRAGQYEAAFNDLSQAAQSNPELVPNLIDLAWGVSRGDLSLTEQLAQIHTDSRRIAFAGLLARRGKGPEAVAQFAQVGNVPERVRRELVEQLLAKGAFKSAFEIWKAANASPPGGGPTAPAIYDGGFEGSLSFGGGGFGWRVARDVQATTISLDSGQPQTGSKDLRIQFDGNSPGSPLVSQIILVEPAKRYRINFASRSQELVTGGLPLITATDASGDQKRLGQSPVLSKGTSDWQVYSFELTTTPQTGAVLLSLQRENCTTSPCPIFGSILLDSFSLEQLN
jgi:hypothetical protein